MQRYTGSFCSHMFVYILSFIVSRSIPLAPVTYIWNCFSVQWNDQRFTTCVWIFQLYSVFVLSELVLFSRGYRCMEICTICVKAIMYHWPKLFTSLLLSSFYQSSSNSSSNFFIWWHGGHVFMMTFVHHR